MGSNGASACVIQSCQGPLHGALNTRCFVTFRFRFASFTLCEIGPTEALTVVETISTTLSSLRPTRSDRAGVSVSSGSKRVPLVQMKLDQGIIKRWTIRKPIIFYEARLFETSPLMSAVRSPTPSLWCFHVLSFLFTDDSFSSLCWLSSIQARQ